MIGRRERIEEGGRDGWDEGRDNEIYEGIDEWMEGGRDGQGDEWLG